MRTLKLQLDSTPIMFSTTIRRTWTRRLRQLPRRRFESTLPSKPTSTPSTASNPAGAAQTQTRFARMEARLPRFLRRYTTPLRTAPLTHVSSFLLLHELTAATQSFLSSSPRSSWQSSHSVTWVPEMVHSSRSGHWVTILSLPLSLLFSLS